MTQQEIKERNKEIALMLGAEINDTLERIYIDKMLDDELIFHNISVNLSSYGWNGTRNIHYIPFNMLQFHSDWNWLMEAVEFIEKLKGMSIYIGKNRMNKLHSVEISYEDNTWQKRPHIDKTIFIQNELKKEAVFIAVSDFAKLYNNKQL